jgi:Ca2+-binding EF-hand superfamily protein
MRLPLLLAAGSLLLLGWLVAVPGAADGPEAAGDDVQDVLFPGEARPLLIRLHVRVDGQPFRAMHRVAWEDYLRVLFRQLDQDGDGFLSEAEAQRLPPPPQQAHGTTGGRPTNLAFNFRVLDTDDNGKLDLAELMAFYREHGGAGLQVARSAPPRTPPPGVVVAADGSMAAAPAPVTPAVSEALFKRLDTNKDGKLSQDELAAAEAVLMPLDEDGDELLTPAEILHRPASAPLAMGQPFRPRANPAVSVGGPFRFLGVGMDSAPEKLADRRPDVEIVVRLGRLQPGESALEVLTPAGEPGSPAVIVRPAGDGTLFLLCGRTRIGLRANDGRPMLAPRLRDQYLAQFRAADTNRQGYLTRKDALAAGFFPGQFSLLDQNGDGRLTEKELLGYLDEVQERQARALTSGVSVLVSDEGRGLFELLDRNRDGKLSVRELRGAARLLAQLGREKEGLSREDVPPSYEVALGLYQASFNRLGGHGAFMPRGMPLLALDWSRPDTIWFHKMDRNRDGDVSPREFLGSREDFRRLDADGDGLISLDEALQAGKLFRKPGKSP